jgi:P2-related tail formation protein
MTADEPTLIPLDDVAYQNDWYKAQGQQVCVGGDGIVRPFNIPLSVRKGWARNGVANPYTNRVEVELIDDKVDRPSLWRRLLSRWAR